MELPLDAVSRGPGIRTLVAVLCADMAGYSRLVALDDLGTVSRLRELRRGVIDPAIDQHGGRLVQTGGDSLLVAFDSIDGAVRCGIRIQQQIPAADGAHPADRRIRFRIGINIGDVIFEGSNLHGDGVNVAARLEAVCPAGGVCVSRAVRDHVRDRLDVSFEALGALMLKNIAHPTEAFVVRVDPAAVANPLVVYPSVAVIPQPDRPSIAVLPFTNMSSDPDQAYFSDGIAEDIITALSRNRALFVIARNSSFAYGDRAVDVRTVARELGVRYVHEGSVRRSGTTVRVNAQLIDAETGVHLWAERYDRPVEDVFAVQDEITNAVAFAIQPAIARAEQKRAMRKPPETLGAWEIYQRGLWHRSHGSVAANRQARSFFEQAIERDTTFAPAYYGLARSHFDDAVLYFQCSFAQAADLADPLARKAVALDPDDGEAYAVMAVVHAARGDLASELAAAEEALARNANCALALQIRGICLVCMGRAAEGCQTVLTSFRINPRDPRNRWAWEILPQAYYMLGDYPSVVETAKQALPAFPGRLTIYRWLLAALGRLGRTDEAQAVMREVAAAISPVLLDDFLQRRMPWVREEDHANMLDGLRKAGWRG
jgi:adenylate cyclase